MKKSIILIICLLSTINLTSASFWSPTSLDLYKNIDKWIYELEDKMKTYELYGWPKRTNINKEVNNLALIEWNNPCLDNWKEMSQAKFDEIVSNGSIKDLAKYIDQKCINDDWKISIETLDTTLKLLRKHNDYAKEVSTKKTDQIFKISNVSLYSDWMTENSWFDLMSDIQDINKIIFPVDAEYEAWEPVDVDSIMNWCLARINLAPDITTTEQNTPEIDYDSQNAGSTNDWTSNINNTSTSYNSTDTNNSLMGSNTEDISYTMTGLDYNPAITQIDHGYIITDTGNNYMCDDENTSWLSNSTFNYIINEIETTTDNNYSVSESFNSNTASPHTSINTTNPNTSWSSISNSSNTSTIIDSSSSASKASCPNVILEWEYEKVTDNTEWWCDDFFCIDIEFKMYEHNLFWASEDVTIQYLIDRSNEHLRKYASTSLIQSKMSTNNFEIWLKDLNLPDIFHMSFQVFTKPVPILEIEPKWKQDETEIASRNLLEEYYKQNGMNYQRRNDLALVTHTEQEKQSAVNSAVLSNINTINKEVEYGSEFLDKWDEKVDHIMKSIEKRVSYWATQTFELEYAEVDKFTVSINDYIKRLYSILIEMDKIPVEK